MTTEISDPGRPSGEAMVEPRRIDLEGAYNLRDVGGYPVASGGRVRTGRIYRSDALSDLTEADRSELARLGIGLVIDLREKVERAKNPDLLADLPIEHRYVPLHDDTYFAVDGTGAPSMEEQYREYAGRYRHRVSEAVHAVLTADRPVVVHCTAGKDRTGVVIALVLEILGVDRAQIEADYSASARFLAESPFWERVARDYEAAGLPGVAVDESRKAHSAAIVIQVIDALCEAYGSVESFLTSHAVSAEEIERFREATVVPA